MFSICEMMKWNHLPASGLLKDQNPALIEKFLIIWREQGKAEEERQREREKKSQNMSSKRPAPRRRARR